MRLIPITAQQAQSYMIGQNAPQAALQQPGAQLGLTQQETATSGQSQQTGAAEQQQIQANIPGVQAESGIKQVQQQQTSAPQNLRKDLVDNKMTLSDAMSKYKALGMSADDILNQYISQSPYGFPKENPNELHNMGVSEKLIGQPGQAYTYADRYNTRSALNEIQTMQNIWNSASPADRLKGVFGSSNQTRLYNQARSLIGEHLSSLIPGGSNAQASVSELMNVFPDISNLKIGKEDGNQLFNQAKTLLMQQKGYSPQDVGLSSNILQSQATKSAPSSGGDVLKNLIQFAVPTAGAIGGGLVGGAAGALVPGADLTGVPEVAGAIGGSGAGGAGGQALADILTGQKPGGDVAITGGLSAAGEGAGAALGGILGKVGSGLTDKATQLISRNLNLTPKMLSDTASQMGVKSVGDFLKQEGLSGADYEKVASSVSPIQKQFDAIAKNPDIKINPESVVNKFSDQINQLKNSLLPADHAKANVLENIASKFIDKFGNTSEIGADTLTQERQVIDKAVKDFGSDPAVRSTANITRDILQKSIQDADPSNKLDALGTKLHQYYTLLGKAEPRQFVSELKPIFGLKDATAGFLGNIFGGPIGAAGAMGLEKMAATNTGVNASSKAAQILGKMLESQGAKQGSRILGSGIGGGLGAILGMP